MTREPQSEPIRIFFSYAHEDDGWRDRLRKHLSPWERQKKIECWSDRQILPGDEWEPVIDQRLNQAEIILLLVSSDFLASNFCMEKEYPRAMERHTAGETLVIPVILRDCLWQESIYNTWQAYPEDLVPVETWTYPDVALKSVAQAILKAVELQREKRSQQQQQRQHQLKANPKAEIEAFETQYLRLQAKLCDEFMTDGFSPDRTIVPLLEDVFVPLDLSGAWHILAQSLTKNHGTDDGLMRQAREIERSLSIWQLLGRSRGDRRFRQMSIRAKGGMGKTTLLRHIALIYGQGNYQRYKAPKLTPVLLRLRDYSKVLAVAKPPSLPQLIHEFHVPSLSKHHPPIPPHQWALDLLQRGDGLVMLDGFDEVPSEWRSQISQWIREQMQEYRETVFIVTSRPKALKEDYTAPLPTIPIFIEPFTVEQQAQFIRRWYLCQEKCVRAETQVEQAQRVAAERADDLLEQLQQRRDELGYLAENPLLLNMLTTFHRFDPHVDLPKNRIDLYSSICKLQLQDRPRSRSVQMLLRFEQSQGVLQALAVFMLQQQAEQWTIERAELLKFLRRQWIFGDEEVEVEAWLDQIVNVSELLVERDVGEYEFPHLSFQGFFAATGLAQAQEEARVQENMQILLNHWTGAVWRDAVLLYTAQLNPQQLDRVIRQACQLSSEAAELAKLCVREYPRSDKLKPDLMTVLSRLDTVAQDSTYRQLETFLKAQQWVEADKETDRLMLAAAGKEEGQYLHETDLLNFPCDALRAIDGLWVKYSQGRFGFSVQKQIYVECGGTLDGVYPGAEVWEKFGDRVGWRKKGDWIDYDNLAQNISLSSPQGIFPFLCGGSGFGWFLRGFNSLLSHRDLFQLSSLAQRLVNCSTQQF
jgi:hypothetical protein